MMNVRIKMFCTFCIALNWLLANDAISSEVSQPEQKSEEKVEVLPYEDLRLFTEVFHQIRANYVNEVSDKEVFEYAIKGMLSGLDPHSSYLNENDFAEIQENTSGEFGGLGLEVLMENGFMKVISPIDDTPAQKAGIKAGDLIIKIDDHSLKGLSLEDSVVLMRGEKGSKVKITLLRENEPKPLEITLERDIIIIDSVKSKLIEKKYGYLRISQFQTKTAEDVKLHIQKLLDGSFNQLQGLVLDLRNNPGGLLQAAVQITDIFLDQGLIVYTEGRTVDSREEYRADVEQILKGKPILVLINNGSASASEIVAGALQDHKRAIIAGTTSFGKGSVQVILPLPHNRGMKLTIARYYTPLGRSIQAEGIKPDIVIKNAEIKERVEPMQIKEADLSKHLKNDKNEKEVDVTIKEIADEDSEDFQIQEAINLLKVMNLSQQNKL